MSNESKRAEGAAEELGGKIKSKIGSVLGSEHLEAEGDAQQAEGVAKQEAAKAAERTKGAVEQVGGALRNAAGKLLGNEQLEVEGEAAKLKGQAREAANK